MRRPRLLIRPSTCRWSSSHEQWHSRPGADLDGHYRAECVSLYVLLDGFDLGIGILYGLAPATDRPALMNAIAPTWDGNETWLVLVRRGTTRRIPAGLCDHCARSLFPGPCDVVGNGVSRRRLRIPLRAPMAHRLWAKGFSAGSAVATFAQGAVLGAFIQGFTVQDRSFAGSSWDWLTPFSVLTGLALMAGYGLLGAGWLVIKNRGRVGSLGTPGRAGLPTLRACRDPCNQHLDAAAGSDDRRALVRLAQTYCCWHRCRSLRWCWPRRRGVRWAAGAVTPLRS